MKLTDDQIEIIAGYDGKPCPTCHHQISIDKYGISVTMVQVLKRMADVTTDQLAQGGNREIDVDTLRLPHSARTQLTKLRFHALIAKVKVDGHHKARHWTVTKKGFDFLAGSLVPRQVHTYNNAVIGHSEDQTDITEIRRKAAGATSKENIDIAPATPAQAGVLGHAKTPMPLSHHRAIYLGYTTSGYIKNEEYDIALEKPTVGKPIRLKEPFEQDYKDLTTFGKSWQIVK